MLQHVHLIDWHWLTIYLWGSFCDLEIDLMIGRREHTFQFWTEKGFYNHFSVKVQECGCVVMRRSKSIQDANAMAHNSMGSRRDVSTLTMWGKRADFFSRYFKNIRKGGDS